MCTVLSWHKTARNALYSIYAITLSGNQKDYFKVCKELKQNDKNLPKGLHEVTMIESTVISRALNKRHKQ